MECQMRMKRYINELCLFKNRASCSIYESKAAKHIFEFMGLLGISAVIDEFKSQKSLTGELVLILFFFISAIIISFNFPWLAVIIHTTGLLLFWGYFSNRFKPLAPLFRHSLSSNVVGRIRNEAASMKVIITAHHDTARSGILWHPNMVKNFRGSFLAGAVLLVLAEVLLIIKIWDDNSTIINIFLGMLGAYVLVQIIILLYGRLFGALVQGANDNASGVAVMLDLAARLKNHKYKDFEFWFVSTGSEETGAIGMSAFLQGYQEDFSKDSTFFIVLDNVGNGHLHYYTGEGMLNMYHFSKTLIKAAEEAELKKQFKDISPGKYRLAYTDAIVPASRGYHTILLLATDPQNNIPNWHWETDTVENIDFDLVQKTSDFTYEMINRLYHIRIVKNAGI